MNESNQYALDTIKSWVWSGFYSASDVDEMIEDILDDDTDEDMLRAAVAPEFAKKELAEQSWPETTDCDRLDAAFDTLHDAGICALHDTGYEMSDGFTDVAEVVAEAPEGHYHGYCFYHGQDVERALEGHGVMLAFGDLGDDEEKSVLVGKQIQTALEQVGLTVEWNGTQETRINIPAFDWKRRYEG